ncbi:MAG: hypothetical protein M0P13_06835 [Fibrobacteraceae bacterium]|nr:hypothetical protein [Fibrobacteraceae bacterium]
MMDKFKNKEEEIYWKLHEARLNKTVDVAKKFWKKVLPLHAFWTSDHIF